MHLKNQPPVFVPASHRAEFEQLSKAALMDMVWDYAQQLAGCVDNDLVMSEFRQRREIILLHRKNAKHDAEFSAHNVLEE